MKKILALLLVLAVAGGVFAQQGEWSLNGKVEIGTYVDFDNDGVDVAVYKSSGYFSPYNYYGPVNGQLGLNYTRDELSIGLTFNTLDDDRIGGDVQYDGGSYKLQASANLAETQFSMKNVGRLWGYYKLVNEMIHLEIAYNSRDTQFWNSDTTGAFAGAGGIGNPVLPLVNGGNPWDFAAPWGGDRDSFTKVDHGNYLLADVGLSNLNFGIMLRSIFVDNYALTKDNTSGWVSDENVVDVVFPRAVNNEGEGFKLVDEVLKKITVGVKLDMSPIEVAAQFRMGDYGAYFGGKWFVGPVTVGLSFMGILNPTIDEKLMKFGGGVDFNPGAFGASIKGFYAINKEDGNNRSTQIGIEPSFFYNVIPTHLQFVTDIAFYFTGGKVAGEKLDLDVTWGVRPQIFWNFLGTGAGGYYNWGTGMLVRYTIFSDAYNALDVSFKFSF